MSAGFVVWALRAGGVVGSLVASIPAWRNVDPLPVLAPEEDRPKWTKKKNDDADGDDQATAHLWNSKSSGNNEDIES